jgi:uncharacterized RDD family membrane protein YckC
MDQTNTNPYRAPESRVADTEATGMVPAERWRRFVNLIVDYIGFFLLSFIIGILIAVIGGREGVERLQQIPQLLVGIAVLLLYYLPQEMLFGRTLGKLVTGTKVVDEKGGPPSAMQVLGRTFSRFIPFEAFSFFAENARGWHDSIPRTYVVKCR